MAAPNAARPAETPEQVTVAGMAADLYGFADERPPLVLLPGLTFDRRIWQPVLGRLSRIGPGRQVLALDLPGHGDSPGQLPHSMQHIVSLIRQAAGEAGLQAPVMAGHSIASVYASQHPARGVVNLDAPPDPALFALLRAREEQIRGDGFPGVWALMKQSFGTGLLPVPARHLVAQNSRPRQDLVVSYWDEFLTQAPGQSDAMLAGSLAALAAADVPYLLITGAELAPGISQRLSGALPRLTTEVWAGTGHFPHLAHPGRFARRLGGTAQWRPSPKAGSLTPAGQD